MPGTSAAASLQIRPAAVADSAAIATMLRASIRELCAADHRNDASILDAWLANKTPANVQAWIENPRNVLIVAEHTDAIAGAACLRDDGVILLNYVAPTHRFVGISSAMLQALEQQAQGQGIAAVSLESTATALRFYLARGYVDASAPQAKHGFTTYPMHKRLGRVVFAHETRAD